MAEGSDGRDLDAHDTPDGSTQDEAARALQEENAETSLDQPSS